MGLLELSPGENITAVNKINNGQCIANDDYKHTVYAVVYSIVFVIGLVSNSIALFVFCHLAKRKRMSSVFLMNLAAADLIFIFSLPFRLLNHLEVRGWPFAETACRFSTYMFYMSMYCSIFFLTGLSVCRYLVMARYVRFQNDFSHKWALTICFAMWIFIGVGVAISLFFVTSFHAEVTRCFEPSSLAAWRRLYYMNFYALVFGFTIPFLTVLICYMLMIKHIVQTKKKKIGRDVAMICLVLTVFCLCFLPYHVQRTVHLHFKVHHQSECDLQEVLQKTVVVTLCLAVVNSCLDPLLFVFVGQGFKTLLKNLFKRCNISSASATDFSSSSASSRNADIEMCQ
ncbi:cysteinyl leukotriene receptor 1-like [Huso huso]|uniref:Cysteinyl leukotriene receptor 1-like n=1 Tax=Huso huso TaxID=61971 RepID=A0ABR0Z1E0_HUSHU